MLFQIGPLLQCMVNGRYTETNDEEEQNHKKITEQRTLPST